MDLWDAGALGMVEARGLAASIVAVDVMAKAAEVKVIGVRRIGGGLVTVSLIGDMASVTAAVEAARQAVATVGGTVTSTVIGRPAVPTSLFRDPAEVAPTEVAPAVVEPVGEVPPPPRTGRARPARSSAPRKRTQPPPEAPPPPGPPGNPPGGR